MASKLIKGNYLVVESLFYFTCGMCKRIIVCDSKKSTKELRKVHEQKNPADHKVE
jgi:hypothetical protein